MLETSFTRLVGCSVPIQLAGIGAIASPELVAAVSEAGGLGQLTIAGISMEDAAERIDRIERLTSKPFGINLVFPYLDLALVRIAAARASVVDFYWGDPDPALIEVVHVAGALAAWQVGSVGEAVQAQQAGCDFISAQGTEAGGHLRGRASLLPLLSGVLGAVSVPVLAAGGIGTAHGLAAILSAGAAGARIGTRFIAAEEANAHPEYVRALIAARAEDVVRTTRFEVDCPMCPSLHSVLRSAVEVAETLPDAPLAEVEISGEQYSIYPFQGLPLPTREVRGRIDAMPLYAGQSVGAVRRVQPAADIISELAGGAETLLARSAAQIAPG